MGKSKNTADKTDPNWIGSREYKLILASDRFEKREVGVGEFRDIVELLVKGIGEVTKKDKHKKEERTTWNLDSPAHEIDRAGFMLRVRDEPGRFKIALKHRSFDRCIAAAQDVSSPHGNGKAKFEEDIVPKFRTMFSRSNSLKFDKLPDLKTLGAARTLFPGLRSLGAADATPLAKVNGFQAHEVFRDLCMIDFGTPPEVEVGLSFWLHTKQSRWPLIAECAFDFEAPEGGDFPIPVVEGANGLFRALQAQAGWFNLGATTKTRFVYDGLP